MSTAMTAGDEPRLVHALPGRIRVRVRGWPPAGHWAVEARLRQMPGVHSVRASALTGNVLIHFDPTATDEQSLLAVVQTLKPEGTSRRGEILPTSPAVPRGQRRSRSAAGARLRLTGEPHVAGRASIPQNGWRRLLSLDLVDLILKGVSVAVSLILAEGPLSVMLGGAEVARLFMEVMGRQSAQRRGEVEQELSLLVPIALGDAGIPVS